MCWSKHLAELINTRTGVTPDIRSLKKDRGRGEVLLRLQDGARKLPVPENVLADTSDNENTLAG